MPVVGDDRKRETNLRRHSLDFRDARERFVFETAMMVPSHAGRGERARFVAVGPRDGRLAAAVISPLGTEAISLINLRPASRKGRRLYGQT